MNLYESLLKQALIKGKGRIVTDVRIGLGYTAVLLDDGSIGLAYTIQGEKNSCNILPPDLDFIDKPADIVAKYYLSPHPVEASVGMASINAILNKDREDFLLANPLDLLNISIEDKVAMIGYFEPLIKKLKGRVKKLWVFERNEHGFADILPEIAMADYLPKASLIIITSVTLINKSLEEILALLGSPRECLLLGPSTPLCPEAFLNRGISCLSGMVVKDTRILQVVSQAKGTKAFKPYVKKVNLKLGYA